MSTRSVFAALIMTVVLTCLGGGTLADPLFPPPPESPVITDIGGAHDLAAGDLDGDGLPDLVASVFSGVVMSLRNQGDGTFSQVQYIYPGGTPPSEVIPGDMNGDGRLDLMIRVDHPFGTSALFPYVGQGDGTFRQASEPPPAAGFRFPISAGLGDLDADGVLDLIVGYTGSSPTVDGQIGIMLGDGDATFGSEQRFTSTGVKRPGGFQVADLNGDGATDLVVTSLERGVLSILNGRGDGTFEPIRYLPWGYGESTLLDDVNRDGHADLVIVDAFNVITYSQVLLGDGLGQFRPARALTFDVVGASPLLADFDGDGYPDLAGVDGEFLRIHLNDGTGAFPLEAQTFDAPGLCCGLASGDFDVDGRPDLAAGGLGIYFNNAPLNAAPDAVALAPSPVECSGGGGAVHLDASGSDDDHGIASYEWFSDFGFPGETLLGTGVTLQISLPPGDHDVTLRVTDGGGLSDTDTILVRVTDTQPPSLSPAATPAVLWPPNGDYHDVHVTPAANDACGPVSVVLVSVTSSEPDADAIQGAEPGTPDVDVSLQADKKGSSRTYTLVYRATDGAGRTAQASATVQVKKTKLH